MQLPLLRILLATWKPRRTPLAGKIPVEKRPVAIQKNLIPSSEENEENKNASLLFVPHPRYPLEFEEKAV